MAGSRRPVREPARCFGIDAEDGRSAVLVERRGAEAKAAEWYPLDVASRMMRSSDTGRARLRTPEERAMDAMLTIALVDVAIVAAVVLVVLVDGFRTRGRKERP